MTVANFLRGKSWQIEQKFANTYSEEVCRNGNHVENNKMYVLRTVNN